MTRILIYNIHHGGTGHGRLLGQMIQAASPDLVGLVEATDVRIVQGLAMKLGMQYRITGEGKGKEDWQLALLSRLPILGETLHTSPVLTRRHVLEVQIEEPDGRRLTVFVIHLTSNANQGSNGSMVRRAEVQELLRIMAPAVGTPHLVMGDFNALAPGDTSRTSAIVRAKLSKRKKSTKKKKQTSLVRRLLLNLAEPIAQSRMGGRLIDVIGPTYAQGGIDLLLRAGYVDCFRQLHAHDPGYTCPAADPAIRIDYLFASPELAARLLACEVVQHVVGVHGKEASDHLPVWADFDPALS